MLDRKKIVLRYLKDIYERVKADDCEISDEECIELGRFLGHRPLSKEQACNYLNLSRSRFDDLVREGRIPKGKKVTGYKELRWYQDELDLCKRQ